MDLMVGAKKVIDVTHQGLVLKEISATLQIEEVKRLKGAKLNIPEEFYK